MNKKIMILGASILQLPAIIQAKEMGLEVVVIDRNPNAIGFKEEGIIKEVISTIDIPKVIASAKKHKIDGIMTLASDMPMRTVAAVAKEMNLVGIDEQTAINATNKYEMRKVLKKNGVPIPLFFKVSTEEEYDSCIKKFDGKFITKPVDNSGSRGIYLVDDKRKAKEAFLHSKTNSRNGDIIVEEYMEGPETSVETLTIDGVCHVIQITDKLTTGAPHFVEMGHSQPSMLDENTKEKIKEITIAATNAIGIKNGPSHTEIIVTRTGPKIVELGARLGGDCITTHLVPLSTGVNMVDSCIKIALGERVSINHLFKKASAIRYFKQKAGTIKSIKGLDRAMDLRGVKDITFNYSIGNEIPDISNSSDRIGFVIAQDDDPEKAIIDCEKALSLIKIKIK